MLMQQRKKMKKKQLKMKMKSLQSIISAANLPLRNLRRKRKTNREKAGTVDMTSGQTMKR